MKPLSIARMFRAAVMSAISTLGSDPCTMAAVDALAESFSSLESMLEYLWKYEDGVRWGSVFGIEYSSRKQDAVLIVTGKSWTNWLMLEEVQP